MGHLVFGDLPNRPAWRAVVSLLGSEELSASELARLTTAAADRRLGDLRGDRALSYCFWLLTRLASASRTDDFAGNLARLGIAVRPGDSALQLIAEVSDRVRHELQDLPGAGSFGEMAGLALRQALMETVGAQGVPLFTSGVDDLARQFRRHSTAAQFGEMSERFFGAFMARTLRFYIERALMQTVGDGPLRTIADAGEFASAIDAHARATAKVVELFGAEWFSKHYWHSDGAIGRDEAQAFTAHALTKLRGALKRSAEA
jgi:hypothetical protein